LANKLKNREDPIRLLQKATNSLVLIKLKNGHEFKGKLNELDSYMNLVLTDAEEIAESEVLTKYDRIFIRGNNILFIKPDLKAGYPQKKK
jgi:small nuclear ribonucleoprotein